MGLFFKKKILVVEDSKPLANAAAIKLKSLGYKVLFAESYKEAVSVLGENKKIVAVWLDHWLRDNSNGLEVLKYIRKDKVFINTPVFLVSNCGEEWSKQYIEAGISKSFVKSDHSMSDIIESINHEIDLK